MEEYLIEEVKGDLFTSPRTASLAHCVSCDLAMSKGIATQFVRRFGGRSELTSQRKGIGDVAVLERKGRFVYYLITKERYYHKPRLVDLKRSLASMRDHMVSAGVTELCIPRIGSGLDGLKWGDVTGAIRSVFRGTGIGVKVYVL